jgi:hypothetical protein
MSTQEPPTKRMKTGRRRRRSRNKTASGDNDTNHSHAIDASNKSTAEEAIPTTPTKRLPLAGITVAVSTLVNVVKNSQQHHDDGDKDDTTNHDDCEDANREPLTTTTTGYKTIRNLALELGATVSSQVHKRVAALVCTTNSCFQQKPPPQDETESKGITNVNAATSAMATQRVRKAIKFNVPLIHVQWLYDCQTQCKYLPWKNYELDKSLVTIKPPRNDADANTKQANTATNKAKDDNHDDDDSNGSVDPNEIPDTGWTPAQDLGCCCVCHETSAEEGTVSILSSSSLPQSSSCPWCTDCSVNRIVRHLNKPTE